MQIAAETMPTDEARDEEGAGQATPDPGTDPRDAEPWRQDMAKTSAADTAAANLRALDGEADLERAAWGRGEPPPLPDVTKLTDEQLKAHGAREDSGRRLRPMS
ncbi:MAG: hypothetical protein MZV65_32030 [Chromatiales bacterium]|nr:hypothetical protein [Chromatiales bacterium]